MTTDNIVIPNGGTIGSGYGDIGYVVGYRSMLGECDANDMRLVRILWAPAIRSPALRYNLEPERVSSSIDHRLVDREHQLNPDVVTGKPKSRLARESVNVNPKALTLAQERDMSLDAIAGSCPTDWIPAAFGFDLGGGPLGLGSDPMIDC